VLLVRFIKRAQDLGFTLDEVNLLLSLRDVGDAEREEAAFQASDMMRIIDSKATRLAAMREALEALAASCRDGGEIEPCQIVEVVNDAAKGYEPPAPPAVKARRRRRKKA
jgi:DNA-binding transcriptional MerR regulator